MQQSAIGSGRRAGFAMSVARNSGPVFQKTDPRSQKSGAAPALRREFPRTETHDIALWPKHRLLVDSRGLGWHDVYTSLAAESSWRRTLHALPHLCLAYCLHGSASVSRRINAERGVADTQLRSRLFGVVPEMQSSMWNLRGLPLSSWSICAGPWSSGWRKRRSVSIPRGSRWFRGLVSRILCLNS
jgi:hypothetical protein